MKLLLFVGVAFVASSASSAQKTYYFGDLLPSDNHDALQLENIDDDTAAVAGVAFVDRKMLIEILRSKLAGHPTLLDSVEMAVGSMDDAALLAYASRYPPSTTTTIPPTTNTFIPAASSRDGGDSSIDELLKEYLSALDDSDAGELLERLYHDQNTVGEEENVKEDAATLNTDDNDTVTTLSTTASIKSDAGEEDLESIIHNLSNFISQKEEIKPVASQLGKFLQKEKTVPQNSSFAAEESLLTLILPSDVDVQRQWTHLEVLSGVPYDVRIDQHPSNTQFHFGLNNLMETLPNCQDGLLSLVSGQEFQEGTVKILNDQILSTLAGEVFVVWTDTAGSSHATSLLNFVRAIATLNL